MYARLTMFLVLSLPLVGPLAYSFSGETQGPAEQTPDDHPTVWHGVYTINQAARGQAEYRTHCGRCHRSDIDTGNRDARLIGDAFMERWREYDLESFFGFIKASMPRRNPESLSDETYVDIVAYFLHLNEFPLGDEELSVDTLDGVQIERPDGPRPVPSGALVQVVGCLREDILGGWTLTDSGEPARTDSSYSSTAEEMEAATYQSLGDLTFRLQSLDFLTDFDPTEHVGRKMQAKDYLIRQPDRARIGLTSIQAVAISCRK